MNSAKLPGQYEAWALAKQMVRHLVKVDEHACMISKIPLKSFKGILFLVRVTESDRICGLRQLAGKLAYVLLLGKLVVSSWTPNGFFLSLRFPTPPVAKFLTYPLKANSGSVPRVSNSSFESLLSSVCGSIYWEMLPRCLSDSDDISSNAVFCAAAQYFHRFYMRFSMEDYPRQVRRTCRP